LFHSQFAKWIHGHFQTGCKLAIAGKNRKYSNLFLIYLP
jgi:hypothetical protein